MPKVSVLMPVYKTDEIHLRGAIESILNQTFTDFEFLILEDCPNDDRENIVKTYNDDRIVYFKNEKNLGITPSRNKLIEAAKGEYLAVMDHDDISLPERFAEEVRYLDEHPDVGVVSCWAEYFSKRKAEGVTFPETTDKIEMALMYNCNVLHPASMIRKSVLDKFNIRYEEQFSPAEDYALWCRLIGKTKFYNIPKILFRYRKHEKNTSKLQKQKMDDVSIQIRNFVQKDHPELFDYVTKNLKYVVRMRLFGIIPIGKFIQTGNKVCKIFKYLPFIKLKLKVRL